MPRGGGIAIAIGAALALAAVDIRTDITQAAWLVFAAAGWLAAIGLVDDHRGLPAGVRLVFQSLMATAVVWITGPIQALPLPAPLDLPLASGIVSWTLSIVWLVGVTNFFNFMDGIDGLAAGQATAICIGVIIAGWSDASGVLAAAVGGASAGFLLHNWPPARIFMGDAGSGFLGFVLAALPFLAPASRMHDAVLALAIGMTLFLLDPAFTLLRRAAQGRNPMQAHREHLYQRLARPGRPVVRVTAPYLAGALLLSIAGAAGYRVSALEWWACLAAVSAFVVVWYVARVDA